MPTLVNIHRRQPAQEAMSELMNQLARTEDWLIPQEMAGIERSAIQAIPGVSSGLSFFSHFTPPSDVYPSSTCNDLIFGR
jgi:hypothetical protein